MKAKNIRGRCIKIKLDKCEEVCRFYDELQKTYAEILQDNDDVISIRCNVLLKGFKEGNYTTDFVCEKKSGELMVRETIYRDKLMKPKNRRLLDASKEYWAGHGVIDWGIVTNDNKE